MNVQSIVRRDGTVLGGTGAHVRELSFDSDGRRVYKALAYDTTQADRHGTRIADAAFRELPVDLPVLLFHHNDRFPVARVVEWSPSAKGPVAGFVFADTDEARTAETLVAGGFLRGVSIGFIPHQRENREGVPTYTDVELVELSLTPTPSSRGALIDLKRSIEDLVAENGELGGESDRVVDDQGFRIWSDAERAQRRDLADTAECPCPQCGCRTAETTAVEDEAAAATVVNADDRTLRLSALLNRLR